MPTGGRAIRWHRICAGKRFTGDPAGLPDARATHTMSYTVRFERGNRGWTCSVFQLGADGTTSGPSVASGTGTTRDNAQDSALAQAGDPDIRAALASSDSTRPHWVQGAAGEQHEAQRRTAAAREAAAGKRPRK